MKKSLDHLPPRKQADLPIAEQRYWKAFNEAPKAGISKRAFETDFQGEWSLVSEGEG